MLSYRVILQSLVSSKNNLKKIILKRNRIRNYSGEMNAWSRKLSRFYSVNFCEKKLLIEMSWLRTLAFFHTRFYELKMLTCGCRRWNQLFVYSLPTLNYSKKIYHLLNEDFNLHVFLHAISIKNAEPLKHVKLRVVKLLLHLVINLSQYSNVISCQKRPPKQFKNLYVHMFLSISCHIFRYK